MRKERDLRSFSPCVVTWQEVEKGPDRYCKWPVTLYHPKKKAFKSFFQFVFN